MDGGKTFEEIGTGDKARFSKTITESKVVVEGEALVMPKKEVS